MPKLDLSNPVEVERFQQFTKNAEFGKITQSIPWSKVKKAWEPLYIYLEDEAGNITASLSILMVNNVVGKKIAYATKGPICAELNPKQLKTLFDEAEKYLPVDEIFMLRCDPEVLYSKELEKELEAEGFTVRNRKVDPHSTIQPRLNMVLQLKGKTEDELLASFHSKTRYNIRYSIRKGVQCVRAHSKEAVDAFYETHKIMAERQGITYRPKEYFFDLLDAFDEDELQIFLTHDEEEILSGAVAINYGDRVWYMYGGSTNQKRNLMPNYLMQWEMIRWGLDTNKSYYDFGGIFEEDLEDGLYRFKNSFTNGVTEYIGEIDRIYDQEKYDIFNQ